ncbi:ABC transporter permease [Pseudohongiella spirulinae]|uniref:ABC-type dipeptide/oligopeptide/nickel transport system, permease component n=1 Tax=Pseudohongiella spirulinae TaxID=1249552 RepID=A0A0S2KA53_9GAMM|nr:ABC transporter permease [Pseudohongiella spirulinae]ALO45248.1 ABC-type dipeptide/oligopeptide/nickel transport system, permease component [Pseudohongiella spirulinae]
MATNKTIRTLRPADFEPLGDQSSAPLLVRPSRSYWQDAWGRLKANKRALVSLYIIIALMIFTFIGPLVWRVDPALQDIDQISIAPGADRRAIVVEPFEAWDGLSGAEGSGFRLVGEPTTQSVRLKWDVMPAAEAYRLYRNIYPPQSLFALGLPLLETNNNQQTAYEDRLDLSPKTYYYSIAALDELGQLTGDYDTLTADVTRVITVNEVRSRGLVENPDALQPGDQVMLKWHPLGTDYLGRDMLARLMAGARVSLFIGLLAPLMFVTFGVLYGATAGFLSGRVDSVMMRFADFVVALPFLLFMILFQVVFGIGPGESGIIPMLIALVILSWPATARLVRGQILQIREEAYVSAARLLGASHNYLILRHMIPNTLGVILVTLTFAVPTAIFTEAFLSFIGMGVAPPTASWGSMSNEGLKTMLTHPHELIFPALMISITVLAFNLLGDGLRDALDAKMRSSE